MAQNAVFDLAGGAGGQVAVVSREEILCRIEEITAELKRPMSDFQRRLIHQDRKDLRDILSELAPPSVPIREEKGETIA